MSAESTESDELARSISRVEEGVKGLERSSKQLEEKVESLDRELWFYKRMIPIVGGFALVILGYKAFVDLPAEIGDELKKSGLEQVERAKADAEFVTRFARNAQELSVDSGCSHLGKMLTCWGSKSIQLRVAGSSDAIAFDLPFGRRFSAPPAITTALNPGGPNYTDGAACAWAVYSSTPSPERFNGAAILVSDSRFAAPCQRTPIVVSYIAIGSAAAEQAIPAS